MKRLESTFMNMVLVLTIISLVAAGLLAYINSVTQGPIAAISETNQQNGIKSVLNIDAEEEITVEATEEDGFRIFAVTRADGTYAGTAVQSTDKSGFSGDIVVLVGFAENGDITGYEVMQHAETPGLGARAGEWFRTTSAGEVGKVNAFTRVMLGNPDPAGNHNIIGMNPGTANLTVSKDGGDIDAITASTITSRAFLRAVTTAYEAFRHEAADAATGATQQASAKETTNE
jgi:electron transport complex protein RnfG